MAHGSKFLDTLIDQVCRRQSTQFRVGLFYVSFEGCCGTIHITMCPAERLRYHAIDDPMLFQIRGGQFQRFGSLFLAVARAEQNR